MAFQIQLPFYAFQLHFKDELQLLTPLTDKETYRIGKDIEELAGEYEQAIQKNIINKGSYLELLDEYRVGSWSEGQIEVTFPPSEDGISYPSFQLTFACFFQEKASGLLGIIPALGLEAFGKREDSLRKRLAETIRIDFARYRRLTNVRQVLPTLWFDTAKLLQSTLTLKIPNPGEVIKIEEEEDKLKLLKGLADPLEVNKQQLFGCAQALKQMEQALRSRYSRGILLVGPNSVGKTTVVREVARHLKSYGIRGEIWETTASAMIKELMKDTGWEYNIGSLLKELKDSGHFLFVRNLMELFEVGKYVGNEISIAEFLQPYLSRGELQMITECTPEELSAIEANHPGYLSSFQLLKLETPTAELEHIIQQKVQSLARDTSIKIEAEAVREVIRLNQRFTPYSGMPGQPIRFLESILLSKKDNSRKGKKIQIYRSGVIRQFCNASGMPVFIADPSIPLDPQAIKKNFNEQLYGQTQAVEDVVDVLAAVKTALTRKEKPIASFLFVGPTGVGKTELAKILASFMFGARNRMLRFDMSEYSDPGSVMRLMGSGKVEGILTAAVRREPFSVLLFDEIEKADSSFYDLLLPILDEGRLTDDQGRLTNFCSTIIIMTSNIGATQMQHNPIGWEKERAASDVQAHFETAVRKHFRPELFNRINRIVPFAPLGPEVMRSVVQREIANILQREGIRFRNVDIDLHADVLDHLSRKGYDPKYGARYVQRTIREELLIPLAKVLNTEDNTEKLLLSAHMEAGKPQIDMQTDPLALELLIEKLNKQQLADHAATLCNGMRRFREAYYYTLLEQQIEELKTEEKTEGQKFWSNKKKTQKYSRLLQHREAIQLLEMEVNDIENKLSFMALDLQPFQPGLEDELKAWKERLFRKKLDLFTEMNPTANYCFFSIYGLHPELLFNLYHQLFREKGFSISAEAVWFREHYYDLQLQNPNEEEDARPYIKTKLNELSSSHPFKPQQPNDLLVGIELTVSGEAAWLYLQGEIGSQKLAVENDPRTYKFEVQAEQKAGSTPLNIHRKEFFRKKSIRREFWEGTFKDSILKINRELPVDQRVTFLRSMLDEQFRLRLEREML